MFDIVLRGSRCPLSQYNHKNFPLRNRSAVYQADLCTGRYVPALCRKKPKRISGTLASGKVSPTDRAKYVLFLYTVHLLIRAGRQE